MVNILKTCRIIFINISIDKIRKKVDCGFLQK